MTQRIEQGQPMVILGDDSKRTQGKDARSTNISAGKAVAESVRTTLGPKGMDKMLVGSGGDVVVTNDGATILDEMDIKHPGAQMIVEVAETQEDEVGDGTTTAAVLSGELLAKAEDLLDDDVHPTTIVEGYDEAVRIAEEVIDEYALSEDIDAETLQKVATTSMTGKGTGIVDAGTLAEHVITAIEHVRHGNKINRDDIHIKTKVGGSSSATEFVKGFILDEEPAHNNMPRPVEDADVLILDADLKVRETEIDAEFSISNVDELNAALDSEEATLREYIEAIVDVGVDVVFCTDDIDDRVASWLANEGILAFEGVSDSDARAIARVTGAKRVGVLRDLDVPDFGHLESVHIEKYGDDEFVFIDGGDEASAVTLFVRGGTEYVVGELERAIEDAIDVVVATLESSKVVPGAGAIEIAIAQAVRDAAASIEGRKQLAVEAFADAMEVIPLTLAQNAGLDTIDTLVELRRGHDGYLDSVGGLIDDLEAMQANAFDDELIGDAIDLARKIPGGKRRRIYELLNERYIQKGEYRTWDLLNMLDIIAYGDQDESINTDTLEQIVDSKFAELELNEEVTRMLTEGLPGAVPIQKIRARFNERRARLSDPNSGLQSESLSQVLYLYSLRDKCVWEGEGMENQLLTNNTSSGPIGVIYSGGETILADPLNYGILEPSAIKREAVESATEAASMIVRIDDVIARE